MRTRRVVRPKLGLNLGERRAVVNRGHLRTQLPETRSGNLERIAMTLPNASNPIGEIRDRSGRVVAGRVRGKLAFFPILSAST
jgi:hypothetical protein